MGHCTNFSVCNQAPAHLRPLFIKERFSRKGKDNEMRVMGLKCSADWVSRVYRTLNVKQLHIRSSPAQPVRKPASKIRC